MKSSHEFVIRSSNATSLIFLCRQYEDYMSATMNHFDSSETDYDNAEEFQRDAHELFVEAYLEFFGSKYGIADIKYVPTKMNIHFVGNDISSSPIGIYAPFVEKDRPLYMNADHLTSFANAARLHYGISKDSTTNLVIVSNAKKVEETVLKNAPTIKDKIVYILYDEIISNTNNNIDFWNFFATFVKREKKVVTKYPVYVLRDYQKDAVEVMLSNKLGQMLLPTGTGKSVIQADFCKRYILERNSAPVILIVSPRIVLTYQLLGVVFHHLSNAKIDAEYINLSSGDMEEASMEMIEKMENKNLTARKTNATTDIREIEKAIIHAKEKRIPLIISSTYHSAWLLKRLTNKINVILCDEAHNLVMGRFSEDFKEETLNLKSDVKFFFTATPVITPGDNGKGMNNTNIFGTEIYHKSYREMIERNEILPIVVQTVNVQNCLILKNKKGPATPENIKDADFDRDITAKVIAIRDAMAFHENVLSKNSADPTKIAPKMLVTVDGESVLKGMLRSPEMLEIINSGIKVFAISTQTRYWFNGTLKDSGYSFKESFMKDLDELKDSDKAVILHIDMIGEGLDVAGITAVMAFSTQGEQKMMQLIGRSMRLHDDDRKNLYAGKFFKGMDRIKMMVKPYAYVIVPLFLRESNDLHTLVREKIKLIHGCYDWVPKVMYDAGVMIGDNVNMTNTQFKGMLEVYEDLTFKQELELDSLNYLMDSYVPQVTL